jgi:hypothetical protein
VVPFCSRAATLATACSSGCEAEPQANVLSGRLAAVRFEAPDGAAPTAMTTG